MTLDIGSILDQLRREHEQVANAASALKNLTSSRAEEKVLDTLVQKQNLIEDAVVALENLARAQGKRRGRRPAWINEVTERRASRKS